MIDGERVNKSNVHVDVNNDVVTVYGEDVTYEKYVYLILNKPQGYISATVDEFAPTVIDLVPPEYAHYALAPVGRLDKDTEGLLLLTNDGKVNHALTSPKRDVIKTYYVVVDRVVTEKHVTHFSNGVMLDDGYKTKSAQLDILSTDHDSSEVHLSITEGKFHQVKRMFKAIG